MQRTPHSFLKNAKERKNIAFFWQKNVYSSKYIYVYKSYSKQFIL